MFVDTLKLQYVMLVVLPLPAIRSTKYATRLLPSSRFQSTAILVSTFALTVPDTSTILTLVIFVFCSPPVIIKPEVIVLDIRETVIQAIMAALQGRVEPDVVNTVQDILVIELNKYEVQERCTDLTITDNSAEGQLRKYVATKRIEGKAESTLRRYYDENLKLIQFFRKPLREITTYDLRFYLSVRRQQGGVSNRTLDGMRRCYSSFFSWLAAEGLIGRNPCAALAQIKYRKQIKKPYSAVELEKLRAACDNARDLALVDFLYSTGCRVSEVSRLDIADVDLDSGECLVVGKGNKERTVYLTDVAIMHLREYLDGRKDVGNALFTGKGSSRMKKCGIEAMLRRLGKAAGVENVHPHRYRRTLATNLLDRGMNIQDVAAILGHADLKTTQIYCYISQQNVKTAYKKYAA